MSNKLKKIFSNDPPDLSGKIRFETKKDLERFIEIMQRPPKDGEPVKVEGVKSLETNYNGYPLIDNNESSEVFISSSERIKYEINTQKEKRILTFWRHNKDNKTILETPEKDVFYIRMEVVEEDEKVTFTYNFQPECANSMEEIVDNCDVMEAFLDTMFYKEDVERDEQMEQFKKSINEIRVYFNRICEIEFVSGINFDPSKFGQLEKEGGLVEELYLLLVKGAVIRLNARLTDVESAKIEIEENKLLAEPEIGGKLDLTFLSQDEYRICEQEIVVHKASLLSNIIIKDIQTQDGKKVMYYDDTDSNPMYISYTGFLAKEEAQKELESIMNHSEKYTQARTLTEHCQILAGDF